MCTVKCVAITLVADPNWVAGKKTFLVAQILILEPGWLRRGGCSFDGIERQHEKSRICFSAGALLCRPQSATSTSLFCGWVPIFLYHNLKIILWILIGRRLQITYIKSMQLRWEQFLTGPFSPGLLCFHPVYNVHFFLICAYAGSLCLNSLVQITTIAIKRLLQRKSPNVVD